MSSPIKLTVVNTNRAIAWAKDQLKHDHFDVICDHKDNKRYEYTVICYGRVVDIFKSTTDLYNKLHRVKDVTVKFNKSQMDALNSDHGAKFLPVTMEEFEMAKKSVPSWESDRANKELIASNKPPAIGSAVYVHFDNLTSDGGRTFSSGWLKGTIIRNIPNTLICLVYFDGYALNDVEGIELIEFTPDEDTVAFMRA